MAALAEEKLREVGGSRAAVITSDLFAADLSLNATVVYTYLLPHMLARLRATSFASLPHGARVISREFDIHGWECGERFRRDGALFIKWLVPVAAASGQAAEYAEGDEVEHMLECSAAESIEQDEGDELDEPYASLQR